MPIFQERQYQAEADIYALNEEGELIIFELKRGAAGEDAVQQVLRYAQDAGQWSYAKLQGKYREYAGPESNLKSEHQKAFDLEHPLDTKEFNGKQHLIIIGSAADESLINAVDYWQRQGVSISFLPYRIYCLGGNQYFEFFALPYDKHRNPGDTRGLLFDTNKSWDEESVWYMMENGRVAAFGDRKRSVEYVYPGDIVFFSHVGTGLIAAGRVKGKIMPDQAQDALYRDVEFITPVPKKGRPIEAMPFSRVSEITGKRFFWARIIKRPYLSRDEAEKLAGALKSHLEQST